MSLGKGLLHCKPILQELIAHFSIAKFLGGARPLQLPCFCRNQACNFPFVLEFLNMLHLTVS